MNDGLTRRTILAGAAGALALAFAGRAAGRAQEADAISVAGLVGKPRTWNAEELAALPQETVSGAWNDVDDGAPFEARGPKLLDVIAASEPQVDEENIARLIVVLTGRDGYQAVYAWGEISPELSDFPVILALEMGGKPLEAGAGPAQAVNPNDAVSARGVFEIASIEVRDIAGEPSVATPEA